MPTFISFLNWTDQGIRNVKEAPNRAEAARAMIKNLGGEIKDVYLTTGDHDLLVILELPDGADMAKAAIALGMQGNVRTTTVRGFSEDEFYQILDGLP